VQEDVRSFLRGTFLEGAPILPICNLTGEGYETFYEALVNLVRSIEPKRTDGVFRLPVERAFSAKGYGTVVAGIPVSGSARVGDEVVLLPPGVPGRLKGVEVYGQPSDAVLAGQCAALNVRHWEHKAIKRGDTVTVPGYFAPQEWYVCRMQLLPHERLLLKSGERVKFHTGTSEVTAAAYVMDKDQARGGDECLVQCHLSEALVAGPGDRFIVRTLSPVRTIGGGMVIEAAPKRLKRTHPDIIQDLGERAQAMRNEQDFVEYCIRKAPHLATDEAALSLRAKLPAALLRRITDGLLRQGKVLELAPGLYAHAESVAAERTRLLAIVADFHRLVPQSPGIAVESLLEDAQLPEAVFNSLLGLLRKEGTLVEMEGRLALPEHSVTFDEEDRKSLEALESAFREAGFHPPGMEEAVQRAGIAKEKAAWALKTLLEHGRLVQVAEALVFHREAVARAREALVSYIRKEGRLESVKFKYVLDTTRKYAIPLLDYFDRIGVTSRVGHTRHLKGPGGTGTTA
jgi:selenocysteine-specific elongation factor